MCFCCCLTRDFIQFENEKSNNTLHPFNSFIVNLSLYTILFERPSRITQDSINV